MDSITKKGALNHLGVNATMSDSSWQLRVSHMNSAWYHN